MDKDAISEIFEEIGLLLELKGENPFKCRAYASAARTLDATSLDLKKLAEENRLGELKGIGTALQEKIVELLKTGKLAYYEELKASFPPGLFDLLSIPGVGPKKVKVLYDNLGIASLDALETACKEHKLADLAGFGEKTELKILAGIDQLRSYESQHLYSAAIRLGQAIVEQLRENPAVTRISLAGSLRRGKEIIKDIDIVASSKKPGDVMEDFVKLPGIVRVTNHGETKSSAIFEGGIPCDLRVVSDAEYLYALHHFTGSKEHNVAMRQLALSQGKTLSEWGLFRVKKGEDESAARTKGELIVCRSEEEIFRDLGLADIPPELRENLGEIEAAARNEIPRLIEWTDLKGTFHCHTNASDGKNTLEEMAAAAAELGLDYLGIADHSRSSFQANGLTEERLLAQKAAIDQFNRAKPEIHLFSGSEVDILKDGRLDFDDSILAQLDYVVASVHSVLNQTEEEMTRRMCRAMENPHVTMLGHPTGRLLLSRHPSAVDLGKIIDCAAETGTWIELNCNSRRLDLDWRWWHRARDQGVKCVINPDAHRIGHFEMLRLGATIARKGWLRREDVINTQPLAAVRKLLKAPAHS